MQPHNKPLNPSHTHQRSQLLQHTNLLFSCCHPTWYILKKSPCFKTHFSSSFTLSLKTSNPTFCFRKPPASPNLVPKQPWSSQFNLPPPFYGPHSLSNLWSLNPQDPLKHFLSQAEPLARRSIWAAPNLITPPLCPALTLSVRGIECFPLACLSRVTVLKGAVWEAVSPLTLTRTSRLFLFNVSFCCRSATWLFCFFV